MSKKVFVGLSGGVDSSVTAALLVQQGYDVTGVYMKNWSKDLPGMVCPWKQDYQDAKRVAVHLGIPFKLYDFETEYRQLVVDYMIREYRTGRTPNPDIMCNQEVKFKLFLETALKDGADMIATGHYARIKGGQLLVGIDTSKDQSYFLYRVSEDALRKSRMPVGDYKKTEVRELAKKFGLSTADKKDSQGICFVGKVGIKDFLLHELGSQPNGVIIDQHGNEIGSHDGALFYTIGQRHGLQVGGGLPFYVIGKDMDKDIVYVTTDLQDDKLWSRELTLTDAHWINYVPIVQSAKSKTQSHSNEKLPATDYQLRTRYRAPLVSIEKFEYKNGMWLISLSEDIRAVTPGQSAVIYDGDHCLGGGIVV